jgi:hypothetical protein
MNQTGNTQIMVCMPMGDENGIDREAGSCAHHLLLRSLTAVE